MTSFHPAVAEVGAPAAPGDSTVAAQIQDTAGNLTDAALNDIAIRTGS